MERYVKKVFKSVIYGFQIPMAVWFVITLFRMIADEGNFFSNYLMIIGISLYFFLLHHKRN
ncbi:MAG: hypothetical protein ACOWWR_18530 [Eubacteriales bacterium]